MLTQEQKTKINAQVSSIESFISRIEKGVVQAQEATDFFVTAISEAKNLFDNISDQWRVIDRWEHENGFHWRSIAKPNLYAGENDKTKLLKLLEVLSRLLPNGVDVTSKSENLFSVKDAYEAKRYISSILRLAGSKILIIDEYLDDQFFDYLDIVPDNIEVRIITGEHKNIFWNLLFELKKKRNNIEARVNRDSHCRYIMIDDTLIYSTDASLNTIGKKDFMIHKLTDEEEIDRVKSEIENYWNVARSKP